MENKKIGIYQLSDKIVETKGACLYRAQNSKDIDSEEDFFYMVKEYSNEMINKGVLEREKKISHEIENYAPKSVVIPILEVLEENSKEYAIMQFRNNGIFLNELIEKLELNYGKGNIPIEICLEIIEEILISLATFHSFPKKEKEIGYLHLDLHPGNIFLESVDIEKKQIGKVKFIDFLSAVKLEQGKIISDFENKIYVYSRYSAPEQLLRETYAYRPCTDLFSVGVIFLRMLMGNIVLSEDNCFNETIQEQLLKKSQNHVMNYALVQFFKCCMEENPKYRYQRAEDMLCIVDKLKKCNKAYQEQDYYTLYSIAYEMVISEKKLEAFQEALNIKNFRSATMHLAEDLLQDYINVPKCRYLFELLWKCVKYQDSEIPVDIKYSLLNSGIACYNHTGDNLRTKALYEEIEKIKNNIPIMDYLGCLNRVAVMYADMYEFEKAYEIISRNINSLETIKKAYIQVTEQNGIIDYEESSRIMNLARAYSAKGTYTVLTEKGNPMPEFEKALQEFGDSIGNKMITISHILQYAIESKNKDLYEYYGKMYFKNYENLYDGLELILKQQRINAYELLIFLKGIYIFYVEDITLEFQNKLKELLVFETLSEISEHPIQLIYKYIGLILYKFSKEVDEGVEEAFIASMTCIEQANINLQSPINIMMCITYQTMWIYNELTGQKEENESLLLIMQEHAQKSGWNKLYEALKNEKSIKEILRYEYM